MAEAGYRTPPGFGLRPPLPSDATAICALGLELFGGTPDRDPGRVRRRAAHLLSHVDPVSVVAERPSGELAGFALARRFGPVLLLAWAAVRPELQGRGLLRAMLAAFPRAGSVDRLVLSSTDPRALRRYASLGLPVHPAISAGGILRPAAVPLGDGERAVVERAPTDADAARLLGELGTEIRACSYDRDLELLAAQGDRVHLLDEGTGRRAAVVRGGSTIRLAVADSSGAARDALRAALAAAPPGATISLGPLTAGMDWAVRVAVEAGLALSPEGPVFADSTPHPLHLLNGSLG